MESSKTSMNQMVTFQADDDVRHLLNQIRASDFKLKPIINEALRRYLPKRLKKGKS